ncbi:MAG: DUF692 domain-containing protein [Pseudomonadales bacterium]|nr:DUF692 domain-containing protein [Pseudomonadales bacterium]
MSLTSSKPSLISGTGLGLRFEHYQRILAEKPNIPWFEVLVDNYMGKGGLPLHYLDKVCQHYPVTFHGVGMSLGSTDPLNLDYFKQLKELKQRFQPVHLSDHIAWISVSQQYMHDLLPLPYTVEAQDLISDRISQAQELLGETILVENPSSYLSFNNSEMDEVAFIQGVLEKSGCDLLLDVNNIFVSAHNQGFDAYRYLDGIPQDRVREIHLAGFEYRENYLYDTHGYRVHPEVWDLYQYAIKRFGAVPTLIEWDNDVPELETLLDEARKADSVLSQFEFQRKTAIETY